VTAKKASRTVPAARGAINEDARETVAILKRPNQTVNLVVVALTDGVEAEVWADGMLRRRCRFLRDTEARKYTDRLAARLAQRGFRKDAELR
jgi:hypothetical protein